MINDHDGLKMMMGMRIKTMIIPGGGDTVLLVMIHLHLVAVLVDAEEKDKMMMMMMMVGKWR